MGIIMGRTLFFGVLLSTLTILHDARQGEATDASLKQFNGTGRFSTIADHNMELELLMESEMGRMLATENRYVTEGTEDSNKAAVDCGRGKPYKSCTPPENKHKVPDTCSTYKRGCPTPS
ncbi:hypothetical protein DITRI_Ditri13aG0153800 [Diplodiscus trichospermus]